MSVNLESIECSDLVVELEVRIEINLFLIFLYQVVLLSKTQMTPHNSDTRELWLHSHMSEELFIGM